MENFIIRKNTKPLPLQNEDTIIVYTDGSCIHNGKPNAHAGVGVYFGENDERNISTTYEGKQSNNVAELLAIIYALTTLKEQIEKGQRVKIYSDSKYAMRCCGEYGEKCERSFWKGSKNTQIPNVEIVKTAYEFCKKYRNIVSFEYIKAHTGLNDIHSQGNDNADRLAYEAIGPESKIKKRKNTSQQKEKIYLCVPYEEKDKAKKLGAKWDVSKKKWYIFSNHQHVDILTNHWR